MKNQILKSSMLALAGAVAFAAAGSASAMAPPYAMCSFKGETTLTSPSGAATTCWTTLTTKVDCDGNVEIVAVGANPGDPNCRGLYTGNLPWTGDAADIISGGATINTDPAGLGLPAVMDFSGAPRASGILNGVGPASATSVEACNGSGGTVTVPADVPVNGSFSSGATFVTTTALDNKGCSLVP
ncbi:hypothetical protein [Alloalcanivorax profundimaris]|uniref:hypothetical protein n=1 Tax=Alloalcanivorax profundimaris TaxID=2735259 RepID=UPI001890D12B|nr:hypothetical protein [Alloalcanivorax profundimaris]